MRETATENAPERVDHICARCLCPVRPDAEACPSCQRRFVDRGRFERQSGAMPDAEAISLNPATPDAGENAEPQTLSDSRQAS